MRDAGDAAWEAMALVGRVARPHGIRGQVIVNVDTDFPAERFQPGAQLFVKGAGGHPTPLRITGVWFQRERPVLAIEGVGDMNAAEALAGAELRIPVEQLSPLPARTFYRHDLIGCRVETDRGDAVGEVTDVEGTLGSSRLVVKTERGEALIPLAEEICTRIDPAAKRIVVTPPEGLLELNN